MNKPLGQILVDSGSLTAPLVDFALAIQKDWGGKLGQILVQLGFAEDDVVALALAKQLNLPPVQLDGLQVHRNVLSVLSPELVEEYSVLPLDLSRGQSELLVATADPTNLYAREELRFHTQKQISFLVAGSDALGRAIHRHYGPEISCKLTQVNVALRWPAAWTQKIKQMADHLQKLEKRLDEQSMVMRGMLDLLSTKGLLGRQELRDRLYGQPQLPPPMPLPQWVEVSLDAPVKRSRIQPLLPDL